MNVLDSSAKENTYKEDLLNGEKIFLRPMTPEDTENIVRWRNTPAVRQNFIYRKPFTVEGHKEWTKTMVNTGRVVQFMICPKDSGQPVGSVYFRDIDTVAGKAEFGIFIGEENARGHGYGTEAARLLTTYGFTRLKLHKIMLRLLAGNERAKRSYEKAGFVQEAYLKDEIFVDGQYIDVIYMALFAENPAI